jgi:hypothetical protein
MAHPKMYSDDDPLLLRLRRVSLAFPEATEKETFGRPTFRFFRKPMNVRPCWRIRVFTSLPTLDRTAGWDWT